MKFSDRFDYAARLFTPMLCVGMAAMTHSLLFCLLFIFAAFLTLFATCPEPN